MPAPVPVQEAPGRTRKPCRALLALVLGLTLPVRVLAAPSPPDIPARAFLLLDTDSGTVLAGRNADERLPPASLTKLMTAYEVFGELRAGRLAPDELVTVSARAARQAGARMFLRAGEKVPVAALIQGMLVDSGNDAAVALAERIAPEPSDFVARMNDAARALGLANTHYADVNGLPHPQHYSSARDLATLALAITRDFPEYRAWFAQRDYTWAGITQPNRNLLLGRVPGVDGLKTGFTREAGYCLVATAARDGMHLVAVLLGTESEAVRARAGRALLDYGFREFETRVVYRGGGHVADLPLWEGAQDTVALGLPNDLALTLPRGGFARLTARALLPTAQQAPVARAAPLARLVLELDGAPVAERPLVTLAAVPEGDFFKRTADRVRLWLRAENEARAAP